MKKDLDEEEASLNMSIKYPNNFIYTVKKIHPENIHCFNFNYPNSFDKRKTDLTDVLRFIKIPLKSIKDDKIN